MLALKGATEQSREGEVNEGKELMSNCKEGIKQKDDGQLLLEEKSGTKNTNNI